MNGENAITQEKGVFSRQFSIWAELIKLRLTTMVLITTAMGFYLASAQTFDWRLLLHALFGTGILACGAAALNQYIEKDFDSRMPRTADRPVPSGKIAPEIALLAGGAMAAAMRRNRRCITDATCATAPTAASKAAPRRRLRVARQRQMTIHTMTTKELVTTTTPTN